MGQKNRSGATRGPGVAYYRKLIAEQEVSGQSVRAFAEERGISVWTLYEWRARLGMSRRRRPRARADNAVEFVGVDVVGGMAGSGGFEVELPNGVRVRAPRELAVEAVADLVRALRSC